MRLVAFLLSPLLGMALAAQVPQLGQGSRSLPWQTGPTPPWQPLDTVPSAQPGDSATPSGAGVTVRLSEDGTLEIWNGAGVRTLRFGLPGRPHRAWRDGGLLLAGAHGTWAFPGTDPLSTGLGGLDWNAVDFRTFLQGLLWILEDGERVLTVVNPATAQTVYLALPRGEDFDLVFEPTRLVLRAGQEDSHPGRAWALPWLALLPQFARLGPPAQPPSMGTALKPFGTSQ